MDESEQDVLNELVNEFKNAKKTSTLSAEILDEIRRDVNSLKKDVDEIKKEIGKGLHDSVLTPKQEEVFDYLLENPDGIGVWDLAEERGISYSAGYKMLEELKEKGFLEDEWEVKGNRKKYKPKK